MLLLTVILFPASVPRHKHYTETMTETMMQRKQTNTWQSAMQLAYCCWLEVAFSCHLLLQQRQAVPVLNEMHGQRWLDVAEMMSPRHSALTVQCQLLH